MAAKQDLLIVMDATASMGTYLGALRESIPEIVGLSKLSGAFDRIGVLAYRDYSEPESQRILWSEWNSPDLTTFAAELQPIGGGDYPEAAKSGLLRTLQKCGEGRHTLILWYADAPPHRASSQKHNAVNERNAFPNDSLDWMRLSYLARDKNCTVFSFVPRGMDQCDSLFYVFLSQVTGGVCIASSTHSSTQVSRLTLDVILQHMAMIDTNSDESPRVHENTDIRAFDVSPLDANPKPTDETSDKYGWLRNDENNSTAPSYSSQAFHLASSIPISPLTSSSRFSNLAKRFADHTETEYRATVHATLRTIIASNTHALSYNPIFGQLWRAVCKDHDNPAKQELVDSFSLHVSQIVDETQKADMKMWLEDSFDATEEINHIISQADANAPLVYLDLDSGVDLTRTELLEVSKSCYAGVLQKLATIFTHLKIVEDDIVLGPKQRSIPLSLSPQNFFRILPHLVVPGTLYPARAASLTAILSLITGVEFLRERATALVAPLKGTWITLEVPENVSFDCARFLLSAPAGVVLNDDERRIYEAMRRYKLIELNLDSTLTAKVPWTPELTRNVGDRKVECQRCHVQRSVTIMSHEQSGVCGICVAYEVCGGKDMKKAEEYPGADDMDSCWTECSVKSCRAQYIVEDVAKLRVRPKCHYCRNQLPCPWFKCERCQNRIVLPAPYRVTNQQEWLCPACNNPKFCQQAISTCDTTARELIAGNGTSWLDIAPCDDLFQGKSAFKLIQAHGVPVFDSMPSGGPLRLFYHGKPVHNPHDVKAQVESRVGRGEVELGSCPLCFNDWPRSKLTPACGRSKCGHRIDETCLSQWYGRNEPGKLLNLMQFSCPFCRRTPVTKVLTNYNKRAAALGGLKDALSDPGWYYAWCVGCGFAKRAIERACCEGERLPAVQGFRCEDCTRGVGKASTAGARVVPCPNCDVMIEKTFGCNHIECQCGQHFCFVCGKGHDETAIYQHMSEAHGGIYDDDGDDH